MKWSAEAKVGLVTIVGVLVFTFVVLTLAHAEIFGKPGFVIHTEFKDANGLQKGNSVRYVGVHVGKVESVKPSRDGVDVAMKLEKGTEIPRDSKVTITTDGLLGEKIVAITPGNDKNHLLADGDYIDGSQGKTMDDMMDSAGKLMGSADDMVKNINAIIGDEKTQAAMRGSIQNIDAITGKTSQMMDANAGNDSSDERVHAEPRWRWRGFGQCPGDGGQHEADYGPFPDHCPVDGKDDDGSADPGQYSDDAE